MAGVYGEINSRAGFFRVLGETTSLARRLHDQQPQFVVLDSVVRQLEAVKGWTDNGRTPSKEERADISFGLIAAREFETAQGALGQLRVKLFVLQNYLEDWPPTSRPPTPPTMTSGKTTGRKGHRTDFAPGCESPGHLAKF